MKNKLKKLSIITIIILSNIFVVQANEQFNFDVTEVEIIEKGNKFIGKNFVFDERRGERISDDIIAQCHQCGAACDTHVNCLNEACHLLFIQCESCSEKMNHCCSDACKEIIALPEAEQRALRKGTHNSNKIFKKGRSEVLKFKK